MTSTWSQQFEDVRDLTAGYRVVDCDTHLTEAPDFWTSRAPAKYKDRVPHLKRVISDTDQFGNPLPAPLVMDKWFIEGDQEFGSFGACVVGADGEKLFGKVSHDNMDQMHSAAWDVEERVRFMDRCGIAAQITYPQAAGFSSIKMIRSIEDKGLRTAVATTFNDAIADFQRASGNRVFPQALLPSWEDQDTMLHEARRCIEDLKLTGFVMGDRPELIDMPDYLSDYWQPFFEYCNDRRIPLNFHLGNSSAINANLVPWSSFGKQRSLAVLTITNFIANAAFVMNFIYSGLFDTYRNLKLVSVESGMGWIPFVLEAMEYQLDETIPSEVTLSRRPTEMFRDHIFGTFWFEKIGLERLTDIVPVENILFETDFPHPTCLYPKNREHVSAALAKLDEYSRRRILQDNAIELYHLPPAAQSS
jgi:predicted TIM-barrel fold metal-dependent hydrolase